MESSYPYIQSVHSKKTSLSIESEVSWSEQTICLGWDVLAQCWEWPDWVSPVQL